MLHPPRAVEVPAPLLVSLDWLKSRKAVPVCSRRWREDFRATHSLSERAESVRLEDGSVRIQIPPLYWWVQFIAVVATGIALAICPFAIVALVRTNPEGLVPVLISGGVIGGVAAPWLIRRRPAVLLTIDPVRAEVITDEGRLLLPLDDIRHLLLVTGRDFVALPGARGASAADDEYENAALLAVRKQGPDGEAVLLFRYPMAAAGMTKAARLAAGAMAVPLEILRF